MSEKITRNNLPSECRSTWNTSRKSSTFIWWWIWEQKWMHIYLFICFNKSRKMHQRWCTCAYEEKKFILSIFRRDCPTENTEKYSARCCSWLHHPPRTVGLKFRLLLPSNRTCETSDHRYPSSKFQLWFFLDFLPKHGKKFNRRCFILEGNFGLEEPKLGEN